MSDKKILVVDDDAIIIKTLTRTLQGAGYKVLSAADGGTATKLDRAEAPDLLILDINLPADAADSGTVSWDAFVLLKWLKHLNKDWCKPVIIITGEEGSQAEARAQAAGAVGFFRKPIDNPQMLDAIRRALSEA